MDDANFLHQMIDSLNDENLGLKSEVAFLQGKVEVYEKFLKRKGYIKDDGGGEE